jgi:hypothetical protein
VIGEHRKLINDEFYNLSSSPCIIRVIISRLMNLAGHVACIGELTSAYKILVRKPEVKRPLWRDQCRLKDKGLCSVEVTIFITFNKL